MVTIDEQLEELPNGQEYKFVNNLSWPSIMKIVEVDRKKGKISYEEPDETLEEYLFRIQNRRRDPMVPSTSYEVPCSRGEEHKRRLSIVFSSDEYRLLLRDVIWTVVLFHSYGKALLPFTLKSNLFMKNNILKLQVVSKRTTRENRDDCFKQDFECVYAIICSIYKGYVIPDDVNHLISCLRFNKRPNLLTRHLALLTTEERIQFFKDIHDKIQFLRHSGDDTKAQKFDEAVRNCRKWRDWNDRICDHKFAAGPLQKILNWKNKASSYKGRGKTVDVNSSLNRFLRNSATHLKDILHHFLDTFSEIDVELIIMAAFDVEILELQEALCDSKVLPSFVKGPRF